MRLSTLLFVLSTASTFLLATAAPNPVASHADANIYDLGGLQEQLPLGDVTPTTRTRTVTETQTLFEVVETVYMTQTQLVPTWVPASQEGNGERECHESSPPPQQREMQDEGDEEAAACDETKEISCAVCRTIHDCGEFEKGWYATAEPPYLWEIEVNADYSDSIPCDSAPACVACQPVLPEKEILPPVLNLGMTCSLGPGRTVPCELVNRGDVKGPVYRFGKGW